MRERLTPKPLSVDPPRVLAVDDDPLVRLVLERGLRASGFDARVVGSADEALAHIEREPVEVVITDLSMRGLDGLSLVRKIREIDVDLPAIVLTGHPAVETATEAIVLRVFRYLTKPADRAVLADAVRSAAATYRLVCLRREAAAAFGDPSAAARDAEARFHRGIEALRMAYQPIMSGETRRVCGYEALLRTDETSIAHPGAFLDLASRLGTLHLLGRAARRRAALEAALEPDLGLLFVNLHPADLADPDLFAPESPLSLMAPRVVLELTEREPLDGISDVRERVERLRALGFRIAVDDLGAGYAALSYFAVLEPDIVKIDMSLIRGVDQSPVKQRTVLALVSLARTLGMEVVAEGIESAGERDVLASLGCTYLQGFFFARPAPPFAPARWDGVDEP